MTDDSQVPHFKLAKVGEKRRKGAGLPFFNWGKGGARGGFGIGGSGGSGAARGLLGVGGSGGTAGALAGLGGKIGVSLLVCALSVGAYSVGKVLAPDSSRFEAKKKPQLFAKAEKTKYEGDLSKLPGDSRASPSGLGMVSGSLDGLTPEERAARAKAEEEKRKAEAEAAAKAEADAGKEQPSPAGAPVDPAALAAAAAGAGKTPGAEPGGLGRKFGMLSNSFGSGLAGGAGLSGGVNRGFDAPKFKADPGKMLAFSSKSPTTGRTKSRAVNVGRSSGKGLARRQLDNAHSLSNQARQGQSESRAAYASAPFDNNPAIGSAITGGGAGTGSNPIGTSGGGFTPNPVSGGGYTSDATDTTTDMGMDDCDALFPDGGYINSPSGGCVKSEAGHSVDPTDPYVAMLKILLIIATVLSAFQLIIARSSWGIAEAVRVAIWNALGYALSAVGAIIGVLGLVCAAMGRPVEGSIFAVVGGLICGLAWVGASGAGTMASYAAMNVITGLMGLGGSVFANSTGSRTYNTDTQSWE
ncbi:MAG TPA: hypothetical protein DEB40_02035 [Elusimicrobia bacterium]|nr:hypothetical protein [Elusimicrobiota bacterium]HBT60510.1 hypothetical protein [Elusimicrobiota bacterium]